MAIVSHSRKKTIVSSRHTALIGQLNNLDDLFLVLQVMALLSGFAGVYTEVC
jgi:hypothetical protein